jgi:hypothetical protein
VAIPRQAVLQGNLTTSTTSPTNSLSNIYAGTGGTATYKKFRKKKKGGKIEVEEATYTPVVVESSGSGYVKTFYDTYTKSYDRDNGEQRKDVYATKIEYYDQAGNLVRMRDYKVADKDVFLRREKVYDPSAGTVRTTRDTPLSSVLRPAEATTLSPTKTKNIYEERTASGQIVGRRFVPEKEQRYSTTIKGVTYTGTKAFAQQQANKAWAEATVAANAENKRRFGDATLGELFGKKAVAASFTPPIVGGMSEARGQRVVSTSEPGLFSRGTRTTTIVNPTPFQLTLLTGSQFPAKYGETVSSISFSERTPAKSMSFVGGTWSKINQAGSMVVKGAIPGAANLKTIPTKISIAYTAAGGKVQSFLGLSKNPAETTPVAPISRTASGAIDFVVEKPVTTAALYYAGGIVGRGVAAAPGAASRFVSPKLTAGVLRASEYGGAALFATDLYGRAKRGEYEGAGRVLVQGASFGAGYSSGKVGYVRSAYRSVVGQSVTPAIQNKLALAELGGLPATQRGVPVRMRELRGARFFGEETTAQQRDFLRFTPKFGKTKTFSSVKDIPTSDYYLATLKGGIKVQRIGYGDLGVPRVPGSFPAYTSKTLGTKPLQSSFVTTAGQVKQYGKPFTLVRVNTLKSSPPGYNLGLKTRGTVKFTATTGGLVPSQAAKVPAVKTGFFSRMAESRGIFKDILAGRVKIFSKPVKPAAEASSAGFKELFGETGVTVQRLQRPATPETVVRPRTTPIKAPVRRPWVILEEPIIEPGWQGFGQGRVSEPAYKPFSQSFRPETVPRPPATTPLPVAALKPSTRPSVRVVTSPVVSFKPVTRPSTTPRATTRPIVVPRIAPVATVTPVTTPATVPAIVPRLKTPSVTPERVARPNYVPPFRPDKTFPLAFPRFGGGGSSGGGRFFLRQQKKYTPSFYALSLGIRGKPSKFAIKSGLGLRPIL